MKKKFIIVLLSVFLVVASAITGVYADSYCPVPSFESKPSYQEISASSVYISGNPTSYFGSSSDGVLCGWFYTNNAESVSNARLLLFSQEQFIGYVASSSNQVVYQNNSGSTYLAQTGLYYDIYGFNSINFSSNVPYLGVYADTLSALQSIQLVVGEVFDFTLPAGYALVIQGECEILERNFTISNSWNFTNSDGNRVNGSSERLLAFGNVVDGFSPDKNLSRSALIQWQALNANIQGTASNYSFNATDAVSVPSGSCFVISYPNLYGFGSVTPSNATITYENSVDLVGNVYLQYGGDRPTIRVVALESLSEFSSSGQFSTYSVFRPALKNEILTPSGVSDDGHTILSPSSPLPSGGGNSGQPPVDEDTSLLGTISRFVNDIKNLLSSAVEAINTLVNDGSSFMQSIGTIFTWLPAPLTALIIAGFTILLVVGVLKVLWR